MFGFLLVDKPAGMTSHDVVDRVRRLTGERTVGHAGTLDPFATGLLILGVGREYTKQLNTFLKLDKEYEATLRLGASSTTGDPEGVITSSAKILRFAQDDMRGVLKTFLGPQLQTPPMHSAKKIAGQKLYSLARQGKTVEREAVPVTIYELELLDTKISSGRAGPGFAGCSARNDSPYESPGEIRFRTRVSSGTYIRTLAEDIAQRLGTVGYLTALRRTKIGKFSIDQAASLTDLTPKNVAEHLLVNLE